MVYNLRVPVFLVTLRMTFYFFFFLSRALNLGLGLPNPNPEIKCGTMTFSFWAKWSKNASHLWEKVEILILPFPLLTLFHTQLNFQQPVSLPDIGWLVGCGTVSEPPLLTQSPGRILVGYLVNIWMAKSKNGSFKSWFGVCLSVRECVVLISNVVLVLLEPSFFFVVPQLDIATRESGKWFYGNS